MKASLVPAVLSLFCVSLLLSPATSIILYDESFGYVDIRPEASIFYWLMRSPKPSAPLVVYMAGGPGDGSSGSSNFREVGPFYMNGSERASTWLTHANLLFIDLPAGAGYSFVRDNVSFSTSSKEIGKDLVSVLKVLVRKFPEFKRRPSYLFGQSYGGRYVVHGAREIDKQVRLGELQFNLKAIGLGSSWLSPLNHVRAGANYLFAVSLIDVVERDTLHDKVDEVEAALRRNDIDLASDLTREAEDMMSKMMHGVPSLNVLGTNFSFTETTDFMNRPGLKAGLGIPHNVSWGMQFLDLKKPLSYEYAVPVTKDVEYLLDNTHLKVVVYGGQFDMAVNLMGNSEWTHGLTWYGMQEFRAAKKQVFAKEADGSPIGFVKETPRLAFYSVRKAGHFVHADQPEACLQLLLRIIHE